MLFTEAHVRQNIRNRDGKRVFYLGKGDQLTSSARDWLTGERIQILPAEQAKPEYYQLLSGATLDKKPEHMTHLQGNVLVPKTHPRIRFRGAMDTLEAELMLCQLVLNVSAREQVQQILDHARQLLRCEVLNEPVPDKPLCGLTEEELRRQSHFPQEFYGQPHFMPDCTDGEAILRLNRCRTAAREAELAAVAAFVDADGNPTRGDLLQSLNRLSSMLYILMIRQKSGKG